ncbi:MAG: insulinase family protein, partial [Thermodesulfobacteriota bacterium]
MNPTGFTCLQDTYVDEIRSQCRLYRHDRTGAEVLSVENQDTNKVFGISFRTPPNDSTGVAHILEHSVLCGSRKYPLKEPFVELLKGSLQTFLNAMTFPDKTCYPVASQNTQDFYNLIDVYLDAVFHPRLTENIFRQEGWHYELESPEDTLRLKGVVYNEMKGAYSSPDGLLSEYSQQTLFPDTTYGLDSGGNPSQIPELTFEQFLDFHRTYYHPSNARIFFYGDDDPEERLRLIDAALQEFSAQQVDSSVGDQAYWQAPKREERVYAAGPDSDNKTMLTVNWLLGAVDDVKANLTLQVLEDILLGAPGAPLRQALLDSGYGEDIAGVGLEEDLKQMFFSTGLKGISPDKAEDVERLLLQTLQRLVDEGLDPEAVQAGLNTVEFELRENNTGSLPRGLLVMIRSLSTWLHDKDPLALLQFEAPLQSLRDELASGKPVFEECIRRYLLDNPHRSTLILQPDTELTQRMEAEEAERLAAARQ